MKGLIPPSVKEAKGLRAKAHALFLEQNEDGGLQFFRYLFVGGAAFVADTAVYMLVFQFVKNSWVCVTAGFLVGVTVNFLLSKLMVFQKKRKWPALEFLVTVVISVIGWLLTEWLVELFFGWFSPSMAENAAAFWAKVIAAGLVLIWNFCARKTFYWVLDRKEKKE